MTSAEYQREWRRRNPGKTKQYTDKWNKANPGKVREYKKRWKERHNTTKVREYKHSSRVSYFLRKRPPTKYDYNYNLESVQKDG